MLGAIIGDIVGSRFVKNNIKTKEFEFLTYKCSPTDNSIMTLALAQAILLSKPDLSDLSKNAVECNCWEGTIRTADMATNFVNGFCQRIRSHTAVTEMGQPCVLALLVLQRTIWKKPE